MPNVQGIEIDYRDFFDLDETIRSHFNKQQFDLQFSDLSTSTIDESIARFLIRKLPYFVGPANALKYSNTFLPEHDGWYSACAFMAKLYIIKYLNAERSEEQRGEINELIDQLLNHIPEAHPGRLNQALFKIRLKVLFGAMTALDYRPLRHEIEINRSQFSKKVWEMEFIEATCDELIATLVGLRDFIERKRRSLDDTSGSNNEVVNAYLNELSEFLNNAENPIEERAFELINQVDSHYHDFVDTKLDDPDLMTLKLKYSCSKSSPDRQDVITLETIYFTFHWLHISYEIPVQNISYPITKIRWLLGLEKIRNRMQDFDDKAENYRTMYHRAVSSGRWFFTLLNASTS